MTSSKAPEEYACLLNSFKMVAFVINCDDCCDSTENFRGVSDSSFELSDSDDSEPNDKVFLGKHVGLSCTLMSFDETCRA